MVHELVIHFPLFTSIEAQNLGKDQTMALQVNIFIFDYYSAQVFVHFVSMHKGFRALLKKHGDDNFVAIAFPV